MGEDKPRLELQVRYYEVTTMKERAVTQPEGNGLKKGCKQDLENAEPLNGIGH